MRCEKWETRNGKWNITNAKWETKNGKLEISNAKSEMRNGKWVNDLEFGMDILNWEWEIKMRNGKWVMWNEIHTYWKFEMGSEK